MSGVHHSAHLTHYSSGGARYESADIQLLTSRLWPRRPRDQATGRPRDVPRHLERPRQPHLRGGDPRAAKGGRLVPQQDSGKVSLIITVIHSHKRRIIVGHKLYRIYLMVCIATI